jgi:hypothetical protein
MSKPVAMLMLALLPLISWLQAAAASVQQALLQLGKDEGRLRLHGVILEEMQLGPHVRGLSIPCLRPWAYTIMSTNLAPWRANKLAFSLHPT